MRLIAALILMASATSALAADPCANANTTLTPAQKKMYARSIASWLTKPHSPTQIKVSKIMSVGKWTAVWATPSDMEQGVYFYSQEKSGLKYRDVWGASTGPSDKPALVQWVKKLDASSPEDFAECFAQSVTSGH